MEIDVRTLDQIKLIKLQGKLTFGPPLDRADETFRDLLSSGTTKFILDLEEVPMIDSSAIGMLVRHLHSAKQKGGSVKLLKPSKFAAQTLKLVRVNSLFEVFEDQDIAANSFE